MLRDTKISEWDVFYLELRCCRWRPAWRIAQSAGMGRQMARRETPSSAGKKNRLGSPHVRHRWSSDRDEPSPRTNVPGGSGDWPAHELHLQSRCSAQIIKLFYFNNNQIRKQFHFVYFVAGFEDGQSRCGPLQGIRFRGSGQNPLKQRLQQPQIGENETLQRRRIWRQVSEEITLRSWTEHRHLIPPKMAEVSYQINSLFVFNFERIR